MKRVYVAGKLNSDAVGYVKNMSLMIRKALELQRAGHSVFVPCLDIMMGIVDGNFEYPDYADNNMKWLEVSDSVFVLKGWENSKGTQKEIERARALNIPVEFEV